MNWYPRDNEVRSSGWSRIPETHDGKEDESPYPREVRTHGVCMPGQSQTCCDYKQFEHRFDKMEAGRKQVYHHLPGPNPESSMS